MQVRLRLFMIMERLLIWKKMKLVKMIICVFSRSVVKRILLNDYSTVPYGHLL